MYTNSKCTQEIEYFIAGLGMKTNRVASAETTLKMHDDFSDVFMEIRCSKALFQERLNAKPYQPSPRYIEHALHMPFKKELERVQEHQILPPLGVDKMAKLCNGFIPVPKSNG